MKLFLRGIGIAAPGLVGWPLCRDVFSARAAYEPTELPAFTPALLPANERRRATRTIKLALQVAQEALDHAQCNAAEIASVFATSDGDIEIVDRISQALSLADRPVSPTDFHNSVHNAPAGYFAIACGSRRPSTSLSCAEQTVAAGILEAATFALAENAPVLLVCYDHPAPPPLLAACPMVAPFGAAFVLSPQAEGALASLELGRIEGGAESTMHDQAMETLRCGNPAARSLPLLGALAAGHGEITLSLPGDASLVIGVSPC